MDSIPVSSDESAVLAFCVVVILSVGAFGSVAAASEVGVTVDSDNVTDSSVNVDLIETSTPTPTPPPTDTASPTPTPTPTDTATPTPTPTPTTVPTGQELESDTESSMQTDSETATSTRTETPTATPTPTRTDSESAAPTPTSTATAGEDDGSENGSSGADDGSNASGATESDGADNRTNATNGDVDGGAEESDDADGTDETDAANATDDEPREETVEVATRSRRPMPSRGPHEGTIVMSFDGVPVSTISFTRKAPGNVTVSVLEGLPPGVADPGGDRLSILRISVPEGVRDSPTKIVFSVEVDSLEAAGIPDDAVRLTHRDEASGEWNRIETEVVRTSDEAVTYAATTPGFSLFAIQGDSTREHLATPTEAANANDGGTATANGTDTDANEAEAAFVGGFGLSMGILLFIGAISVGLTVFGARQLANLEVPGQNSG